MILHYNRYAKIKDIVADTLCAGQIANVPICCFQLTTALNIKCIPYSSLSIDKQSACLQLSEEGFTLDEAIYYNDFQLDTRIRFTIMHELGHIMLDHAEDDEIAEIEANFFAGYILVPPILVYAHDKTGEMDQETIKRLFYVSAPVAEYGFSSYCGWIKRNAGRFGFEDVDTRIYNHFFPPYL